MSKNSEIDAVLIEKVKKGDRDAFTELVDRYKNISLSLACSVLKDKARAEDVLQEVFIKVFYKANTFRHQSSFSTWLYRIVINAAFNELKRGRPYLELEDVKADAAIVNDTSGFQNLKGEEQRRYIVLALDRLKPDEALAMRLFYLCEMNLKEVADVTGFGLAKVKVVLHRGRKNFEIALMNLLGNQIDGLI